MSFYDIFKGVVTVGVCCLAAFTAPAMLATAAGIFAGGAVAAGFSIYEQTKNPKGFSWGKVALDTALGGFGFGIAGKIAKPVVNLFKGPLTKLFATNVLQGAAQGGLHSGSNTAYQVANNENGKTTSDIFSDTLQGALLGGVTGGAFYAGGRIWCHAYTRNLLKQNQTLTQVSNRGEFNDMAAVVTGKKPAALINTPESVTQYKSMAYQSIYNALMKRLRLQGHQAKEVGRSDSLGGYVIGKPNNVAALESAYAKPWPTDPQGLCLTHARIGAALGYPDHEIEKFLIQICRMRNVPEAQISNLLPKGPYQNLLGF